MSDARNNSSGSILVVRGGAIGDFILTFPALAALRAQFPGVHLELLGYPHIAQLAVAGGLVDRIQSIEARPLAGFFADRGPLDDALADYFSDFDLILSYLYDPDEVFRRNVARCSGAQFIAGPHRPKEGEATHATEVFLKPLERLAIFDADPVPRLELCSNPSHPKQPGVADLGDRPVPPTAGFADPFDSEWLALHPGSGSERKNWPEARWADLLRELVGATNWSFLLIGGEAEGDRLERLAALIPSGRLRLAKNLPLAELAHCLRQGHAYLGHDSGISHLAAAVGLTGIVLWGETDPAIWRPRSDRISLLHEPGGLGELAVDRVWQALQAL